MIYFLSFNSKRFFSIFFLFFSYRNMPRVSISVMWVCVCVGLRAAHSCLCIPKFCFSFHPQGPGFFACV